MLLLTTTEFRNNISKYLQLALTEKIAIKNKRGIIKLNPNTEIKVNPSPSNDPYFDDPANIEAIEKGIADIKAGDKKLVRKVTELIDQHEEHPRSGLRKPKQLKGYEIETWSRKINDKHRLIYQI